MIPLEKPELDDIFPIKIETWQVVEQNLVAKTDVLFVSCMKICGLAFRGCCAWRVRDSLKLELLSSEPRLILRGSSNCLSVPFAQ